jgi:hypothetical protein
VSNKERVMSFFSRQQRYEMLCAIKRGHTNPNLPTRAITAEEEAFIVEFATEKFNEVMQDPEVVAVMKRLKER